MKIQKLIFALIILSVLSCSKDDDTVIVEAAPEYPMKSLMEAGVMELKSTKVNGINTHEIGYRFKAFKNGKITALGIRVPENDTYRVTLWNADTQEILKTAYIDSTSGLLSFEDIEPINISSGTEYYVAVNTNDYYVFNDNGNPMFPVESHNILIVGYSAQFGANQALPVNVIKTAYLGMVDVKFVPNN
ncbi:DUF4082 domain-containing protein [Tamlana sp. 2201CG12-4]|uniref:DUF4082 domain-containing protein n=1 Tax=Tamlana sp. 2201CG12-4 TaxID=3112582 RepID=UPI002DBB1464|nr:DUF4082 domain-containing protein [Tamlana sp. 2201CG12-4]MEC3908072.1 DUF4082 domain-containing protein [Tamlana sp. 2201CG12-4]